ncbi:ABC transporter substrate-binding protein [Castellaniella sp.]|uniref:ABC transporter substrate-binding protein n=1 Tax=Castellaniella sp. TaxID=1955812 RepID=UPI00355F2A43
MKTFQYLKLTAAVFGALAIGASAQAADEAPLRIGAIVDMSGIYSAHGGPGGVAAVKMAINDFGGTVNGRKIELLSADYQNKLDITLATARKWYDQDGVEMIIESTDSASAIGLQKLAQEKDKVVIFAGSASSLLSNENCSPNGIHYVYDTYALAHGTGAAVTKNGGDSWYFITADYAFGHALEKDTADVVKESGGKVLGAVRAPLNTADFSSFLLQAQSSGAKVIGLANAGTDTQNTVRQASEFGITQGGQQLATLLVFLNDVKGMGLEASQGLQFTTGFYWDRDDETRAFAKRFYEVHGAMPSMVQAGMYSATMAYLNAVKEVGADNAKAVVEQMKKTPIDDFYTHNGHIREDGRMVYDMLLVQAKTPEESTGEWDLLKINSVIPAEQAWRPLSDSVCPLVKK